MVRVWFGVATVHAGGVSDGSRSWWVWSRSWCGVVAELVWCGRGSGNNEGEGFVISGQRLRGLAKKRVYWENFLITSHFWEGFA